jgi:membrane protease YdiL (CAAX protease family)
VTTTESTTAPIEPPAVPPSVATAKPPRVWKFAATLAWSVLLYGVMTISAAVGIAVVIGWFDISLTDKSALVNDGLVIAATSMSATIPVLLVIALAVRLARQKFRDYLALRLPSARHAAIGVLAIVLLMILIDTTTALIGRSIVPDVMLDQVRSASGHGALGLFAVALVITAPITEEIAFRGFIYRGFSASRLGTIGAVALSSLIFTAIHIQYDLFTLCGVMLLAVLLGAMRAISGSTLLTIAMHALNNGVVLVEAMGFAGMLSR